MNGRAKLYSTLNVAGWVVLMPVLVVMLMSPFVSFSDWPGRVLGEQPADAARVVSYPRLRATFGVAPAKPAALEKDIEVVLRARPALPRATELAAALPRRRAVRRPSPQRDRVPAKAPVRRPATAGPGTPQAKPQPAAAPSRPQPPAPEPEPSRPQPAQPAPSQAPPQQPPSSTPGQGTPPEGPGNSEEHKPDEPGKSGENGGGEQAPGKGRGQDARP